MDKPGCLPPFRKPGEAMRKERPQKKALWPKGQQTEARPEEGGFVRIRLPSGSRRPGRFGKGDGNGMEKPRQAPGVTIRFAFFSLFTDVKPVPDRLQEQDAGGRLQTVPKESLEEVLIVLVVSGVGRGRFCGRNRYAAGLAGNGVLR